MLTLNRNGIGDWWIQCRVDDSDREMMRGMSDYRIRNDG